MPSPDQLVSSSLITRITLHNPLPRWAHTYILPFLPLYPLFGIIYFFKYDEYIGSEEWTFVYFGSLLTLNALTWLCVHWSVNLEALFTATKAKNVREASLVKVEPGPNQGKAEMCKLEHVTFPGDPTPQTSFLFQKKRFIYNEKTQQFQPVIFPIDNSPPLSVYQHSMGIQSKAALEHAEKDYGFNRFDIPIPGFKELFQEHAVAPFFVFQIFCVGLWCLDEYWYYSIFTLVMLVIFESTVVWQRQRTLAEFRTMGIKPYPVYTYRCGKWTEVLSDELFPGDLISIVRTKEDSGLPCDAILISGGCIVNEAMLSGESTPLLKESIALRPGNETLDTTGLDKNSLLYGGTKVLQTTPPTEKHELHAPDDGVLAVVTRTGFETSQGSLVRTMIYSTERVSANNFESLLFILFLLVFAIVASWYVWVEGVRVDRKRSKLLLDCILIITSVVPPELPMELSLAVNTSLAALSKYAIYCTEPFRIPYAGRIDIACFDKTGTLTGEDLVVEGVAGQVDTSRSLTGAAAIKQLRRLNRTREVKSEVQWLLATANALVRLDDGTVVGDPMEKATLDSLHWGLLQGDTIVPDASSTCVGSKAVIRRRFQFSSALKRQSTVSTLTGKDGKKRTFIAVKGAPETIAGMIRGGTTEGYEEVFKGLMREGSRVLGLGYRIVEENMPIERINKLTREDVERDLLFGGFLVFNCPLKDDAKATIQMLNESSHRCVMITGDNPLTAVHVAREVEIVDREVLILDVPEKSTSATALRWQSVDEKTVISYTVGDEMDKKLFKEYDICLTGPALAKLDPETHKSIIFDLLSHTWVYARVSPSQKEFILNSLKEAGYTTLMCGDGTNDVGALKQAHVGVALLNGSEDDLKRIAEHQKITRFKAMYEKQVAMMQKWAPNGRPPPVPFQIAHLYPEGPSNPHRERALAAMAKSKDGTTTVNGVTRETIKSESSSASATTKVAVPEKATPKGLAKGKKSPEELAASMSDKMFGSLMEEDESEPPTIKLGDASVAAPFTSKLANVIAIANIIRQGRCTLVAMIQMYKILALNCLISAYSLSVLYLKGIKFGDGQATISGMLMSVCFLGISRAKPIEKLSKERPQANIFNIYLIGSVLGQFAVHVGTLIYISQYVAQFEKPEDKVDLEAEFKPSLLNSAIYLVQLIQQVSTFAINYQGRPFRESIRENRSMWWSIVGVAGIAFACSIEFIPELNEKLKLVKFTPEFQAVLTMTMVVDYVGCWIIEQGLKYFFSDNKPKEIATRNRRGDDKKTV